MGILPFEDRFVAQATCEKGCMTMSQIRNAVASCRFRLAIILTVGLGISGCLEPAYKVDPHKRTKQIIAKEEESQPRVSSDTKELGAPADQPVVNVNDAAPDDAGPVRVDVLAEGQTAPPTPVEESFTVGEDALLVPTEGLQ